MDRICHFISCLPAVAILPMKFKSRIGDEEQPRWSHREPTENVVDRVHRVHRVHRNNPLWLDKHQMAHGTLYFPSTASRILWGERSGAFSNSTKSVAWAEKPWTPQCPCKCKELIQRLNLRQIQIFPPSDLHGWSILSSRYSFNLYHQCSAEEIIKH